MCCRDRHVRRFLDHGKLGNMIAAQPVQTRPGRPSMEIVDTSLARRAPTRCERVRCEVQKFFAPQCGSTAARGVTKAL